MRLARAAAGAALGLLGCSSQDRPPPLGDGIVDGSIPDAPLVRVDAGPGTPDARPPVDASGIDVGLGLAVADTPDTPCAVAGGASAVVYPASDGGGGPAFDSLRAVGTRRLAVGSADEGFVLFDTDGGNPSAAPIAVGTLSNRATSTGSAAVVAGASGQASEQILFARYDPSGAPLGKPGTLANERADALAAGGGDGLALFAWSTSGSQIVRAAGLDASGAPGAAYDFAITNFTDRLTASIASDGSSRFAMVFSGDDTGTTFQTGFGRGTAAGRVADPFALFTGDLPRAVAQLVKTPSGYALVLSAGGPAPFAALVLLDASGRTVGPAHRLDGAVAAYGVAVQGTELGVVARRLNGPDGGGATHAVEFRPFDAAGAPAGPWVCLEGPSTDTLEDAAIDADGTGYAALYRAPDGSEVLARFDHLGTGHP